MGKIKALLTVLIAARPPLLLPGHFNCSHHHHHPHSHRHHHHHCGHHHHHPHHYHCGHHHHQRHPPHNHRGHHHHHCFLQLFCISGHECGFPEDAPSTATSSIGSCAANDDDHCDDDDDDDDEDGDDDDMLMMMTTMAIMTMMMMMYSSIGEYIANDDNDCVYDHGDGGDEPVDLDDHGHDNDEGDSIFSSIGRCTADDNDFVYFTDSAIHLVVHCVDVHDDENCVTSGFVGRSFVGFPR